MKGKKMTMTRINAPDFERYMIALNCEEPDRVPLGEWSINKAAKEWYLRKKIESIDDEIEFWASAGFDFIPASTDILGMKNAPARIEGDETKTKNGNTIKRQWVREHEGIITNWDEFERFKWPAVDNIDLTNWEYFDKNLPAGMKAILLCGRILAPVWMYMGTETFYYSLKDNEELVAALFEKTKRIQFEIIERVAEHECLGAILVNDDIAHNNGLMINPIYLEKYVFPFYRKIGELCNERGLGYVFHSDGDCTTAMDQIIQCGFKGFNPIQPNAMDILEIKRKWGKKICLIGNINLDSTLTLGTPDDVRAEVHERIRTIAPEGGYMVASSNSITDYVPVENMKAMFEAALEYGRYPILLNKGEVKGKISEVKPKIRNREKVADYEYQLKRYSDMLLNSEISDIIRSIEDEIGLNLSLTDVVSKRLIPAMTIIGKMFQDEKIYIPEMMISASAMSKVLDHYKDKLILKGSENRGVVVIGTVKGDLHDIGKNLVSMMLEGQGFKLIDLGVSVSQEKFINAIIQENADIVALSALLTTTMVEMQNVIGAIRNGGLRNSVKIIVGGAPVTQEFADQIGADGYAYDAPGAADKCKELFIQNRSKI